jgi:hypothetical protein
MVVYEKDAKSYKFLFHEVKYCFALVKFMIIEITRMLNRLRPLINNVNNM